MSATETQNATHALNAYLALLKSKGATTGSINQRKHFLRYLLAALDDAGSENAAGTGYRDAVDHTLKKVATEETLPFFLAVAREFYPFWTQDLKTVAALNAGDGFALEQFAIPRAASLDTLLRDMSAARWKATDSPALTRYLADCLLRNDDKVPYQVRERLLPALLFVIRDRPASSAVYRAGVNAMLVLLPGEDTRQAFLQVIREFFPYWQDQADVDVEMSK